MDALNVPRDTPWDELPHVVALRCRPIDRAKLYALVHGGLLNCLINDHGRINHQNIHHATKRVTDALHAFLTAKNTGGDAHS